MGELVSLEEFVGGMICCGVWVVAVGVWILIAKVGEAIDEMDKRP